MSEWDDELFPDQKKKEKEERKALSGPWDIFLTVFTLGATTAASFLMAYMTKDIPSRPFWMLALCFAVPVAVLMFSAWFKEKVFPRMTPNSSRKAQLILVLCSILAAAVVGCFCQVSNSEVRNNSVGWSNVLIILDKSGSMNVNGGKKNENATNAVVSLVRKMQESTRIGLLIDVDWDKSLEKRTVPIAPLTEDHRSDLIAMSGYYSNGRAEFPASLDTAYSMLSKEVDPSSFSVLYISDGDDVFLRTGDRSKVLDANDYYGKFNSLGVKINYIYVDENNSNELEKLAQLTGGDSIFAAEADELADQVQKMVIFYDVKDALRNINESGAAKTVTAILLLLLGILIGFSLTIMFSLQGQKRAQTFISPLMALLAFLLLAFGQNLIPDSWLREGVAFSLLGLVVMRCNRIGAVKKNTAPAVASPVSNASPDNTSPSSSPKSSGSDSTDDLW